MPKLSLRDRLDHVVFNAIYSRNLIYNTCWEDPAIDRQALAIGSDDTVLAITSAGCNVLDYALLGPRQIYAVDARRTAQKEAPRTSESHPGRCYGGGNTCDYIGAGFAGSKTLSTTRITPFFW